MLHHSASESLSEVYFVIFCVFHMLRRRLSSGAAANFSSSSFKFVNNSQSQGSQVKGFAASQSSVTRHAEPHHGGKSRSGICESPCNLQASKLTQLTAFVLTTKIQMDSPLCSMAAAAALSLPADFLPVPQSLKSLICYQSF